MITIEGNLIPAEVIDQIVTGTADGQTAPHFGLPKTTRLSDEIATAWADARAYWEAFGRALRRVPDGQLATSETREQWIYPLLRSLGYDQLPYQQSAEVVGGLTYAISNRAGTTQDAPPVHIVGIGQSLDKKPLSGRPRLSPHALMQEYLNGTEHLWGIITNGALVRILRDASRTTRPTYIEFDLRTIIEGEKFNDFALFYRLLHRTRLPQSSDTASNSWLEKYYQQGVAEGGRVRDKLRDGVEAALIAFGNGLLQHPANHALVQKVNADPAAIREFYRQLLRLVYRLLFLMTAEERTLIGGSAQGVRRYLDYYSVSRLRRAIERPGVLQDRYEDLWQGLLTTFAIFEEDKIADALEVTALDGGLFGAGVIPDLTDGTSLYNHHLATALRALSLYYDDQSKLLRRINYRALDVEELGSVYESLLDYRPVLLPGGNFALGLGTERKSTGSYYTRPELVQELIKSALEPVLAAKLQAAGNDAMAREAAILSMKVVDPAAGSGHFLLAAARRLGRELAQVRSGEEQPAPSAFRRAVRDVIGQCIYGVDANPLAVDLCKLALWLEGYSVGLPLNFLDHHIRHGNSLLGTTRALMAEGIPDDAYTAVSGDDKAIASAYKKRNKEERKQYVAQQRLNATQPSLFESTLKTNQIEKEALAIEAANDNTIKAVHAKAERYSAFRGRKDWRDEKTLHDIWTAAFFIPITKLDDPSIPTTQEWATYDRNPSAAHPQIVSQADPLAQLLGFFHWHLEFPHIFGAEGDGGFDVVLGNPPWERIKLQEQEFWAGDAYIARAANKAERERRITAYRNSTDPLQRMRIAEFDAAKHAAESTSRFVRGSSRFPFTAVGDVNTYALFSEHSRDLLNDKGRAGIIVPIGIATDDTTKAFFGDLAQTKRLDSLKGFENEAFIFSDVHHAFKFCVMTMTGRANLVSTTDFVFFCRYFQDLEDPRRHFQLTAADIALVNPNTHTTPIFRTKQDAELTKKIYRRVPVLENERTGENPWGISFSRMLDMSNDSHLFQEQWNAESLPLYEAKMMWQFDHRFSTYENATEAQINAGILPQLPEDAKRNPQQGVSPRYWVDRTEVFRRLEHWSRDGKKLLWRWDREWLLGFRGITNTTNEKTGVFSLLPKSGLGNSVPLISLTQDNPLLVSALLATLNSLVLDYISRNKTSGSNFNFFILKQLSLLPPTAFDEAALAFIVPRVLELVYTAWDIEPFARDVLGSDPPPPYVWNEERRAHLRADLDAYIARLYGLTRDELRYILDPADVYGEDFPGETFRVLKEKEIKLYGEYRTRRLVLAAWDEQSGQP